MSAETELLETNLLRHCCQPSIQQSTPPRTPHNKQIYHWLACTEVSEYHTQAQALQSLRTPQDTWTVCSLIFASQENQALESGKSPQLRTPRTALADGAMRWRAPLIQEGSAS